MTRTRSRIPDDELVRLAEGYAPEELEPTVMSLAAELRLLRAEHAAVADAGDLLESHANRIRRYLPSTAQSLIRIIDAHRTACS